MNVALAPFNEGFGGGSNVGGWSIGPPMTNPQTGGNPGAINNAAITAAVNARMGDEIIQCTALSVTSKPDAGAFPGGKSLLVTATCQLRPLFKDAEWSNVGLTELKVTAAMPL